MDRISHLPESIVHHILDYIHPPHGPPIELVRMSVLSKTWFHLTACYPVLDFVAYAFTSRESFFKYVEYTTSRFCHQNVTAHKFSLFADVEDHEEMYNVDKCVKSVLQNGVREMNIYISSTSSSIPKYRLPNILLLSVSVLESLTISYCELPYSLMDDDAVKFKSLIRLTLENVRIDDEGIKRLTTGCPLLQELKFLSCFGFKSFCVYGHQSLQRFSIDYHIPFERLDIEAPNLSYIWVRDIYNSGPPRMNVASCKKLTTVTYFGHLLPNDFLSNLPFIENLGLIFHDKCKNLKWSSHSLRTLVLQSDCDLNEIELNTPKLVLFVYGSVRSMTDKGWSLLGDSTHLKAYMDARWLQKLRLFMEKKNGFKALDLYIDTRPKFIELGELNDIKLPPCELEHVELQLDTNKESSDLVSFVAAVLWFFSPQSLTLRSSFPLTTDSEDVVKLISEKLSQQEDQGHTNIQIVSCHEGKTISFLKKKNQDNETAKGMRIWRFSDALDVGDLSCQEKGRKLLVKI